MMMDTKERLPYIFDHIPPRKTQSKFDDSVERLSTTGRTHKWVSVHLRNLVKDKISKVPRYGESSIEIGKNKKALVFIEQLSGLVGHESLDALDVLRSLEEERRGKMHDYRSCLSELFFQIPSAECLASRYDSKFSLHDFAMAATE